MPSMPTSPKASLTSSNLNGLIIASIFFISVYRVLMRTGRSPVCQRWQTFPGRNGQDRSDQRLWTKRPLAAGMPELKTARGGIQNSYIIEDFGEWKFLPAS